MRCEVALKLIYDLLFCLHVCFLLYVACTVYGQCVIVYVSDFFTYKIIDIRYTDIYLQLYGKFHKNCNIFAISLERNTKDIFDYIFDITLAKRKKSESNPLEEKKEK